MRPTREHSQAADRTDEAGNIFRFKRSHARTYGQRWQSETTNSMIKRNLGSAMRTRTAVRRRHELLLRVLTHNIMLLAEG